MPPDHQLRMLVDVVLEHADTEPPTLTHGSDRQRRLAANIRFCRESVADCGQALCSSGLLEHRDDPGDHVEGHRAVAV